MPSPLPSSTSKVTNSAIPKLAKAASSSKASKNDDYVPEDFQPDNEQPPKLKLSALQCNDHLNEIKEKLDDSSDEKMTTKLQFYMTEWSIEKQNSREQSFIGDLTLWIYIC